MEGRQAVRELLAARRRHVAEIWLTEGSDPSPILGEIDRLAREEHVPVRLVSQRRLESVQGTEAPQGVVAFAEPLSAANLDELVLGAARATGTAEGARPALEAVPEVPAWSEDELDDDFEDGEADLDTDDEDLIVIDLSEFDDADEEVDLIVLVDVDDDDDGDYEAEVAGALSTLAAADWDETTENDDSPDEGDTAVTEDSDLGEQVVDAEAPAFTGDAAAEPAVPAFETATAEPASPAGERVTSPAAGQATEAALAFLVLLEGVTDPQNLGAILRSAECAGVTGVAVPRHRSVHVTPAVTKAAAGAIEHLPMALVSGIPSALQELERLGVMTVGLDERGTSSIYDLDLGDRAVALVLGSEGNGLSPLSRRRCDVLCRIPLDGEIPSLNVSAAAAVACFEVARQRTNRTKRPRS